MRIFVLFPLLTLFFTNPLCATDQGDYASHAQISAMAARLEIDQFPCRKEIFQWFERQDPSYVEALKTLIHANHNGRFYAWDLLKYTTGRSTSKETLHHAAFLSINHPYAHLTLLGMAQGNDAHAIAWSRLLDFFDEDLRQEGAIFKLPLGGSCLPDVLATVFMCKVRESFPRHIELLGALHFRTYQLQLLMPYAGQLEAHDLHLLRHLLAKAHDGTSMNPTQDVTLLHTLLAALHDGTQKEPVCPMEIHETKQTVAHFVRADKETVASILGWPVDADETKELLSKADTLSAQRLRLASYLREEFKGPENRFNLVHFMGDEVVDALLAVPSHVRSCVVCLNGSSVTQEDILRMAQLFEGCDEEVRQELSYRMKDIKPTDAEIGALNDLQLTPFLRMGALIARNWIPLSAARPDRLALLERLLQGCDVRCAAFICLYIRSYTFDRLICLEEIAGAGICPEARQELVSQFRPGYRLPREALQGAFTAARSLPVEKLGRLLIQASDYPDPAAFINASLQDLQTAPLASSS